MRIETTIEQKTDHQVENYRAELYAGRYRIGEATVRATDADEAAKMLERHVALKRGGYRAGGKERIGVFGVGATFCKPYFRAAEIDRIQDELEAVPF